MTLKILGLFALCLLFNCGTTKDPTNNTTIIFRNPSPPPVPHTVRLWLRIEGGVIRDNVILSDDIEELEFHSIRKEGDFTKLFIRSKLTGKMYVFWIPHRNGEFVVEGYSVFFK